MSKPDPWLEQYGSRRGTARRARRVPIALAVMSVAAVVVAASLLAASRGEGWRPPSGLRGFRECTYGGRVAARCAGVNGLQVAVIPATRQPARGALFYLEGGPGGAATAAAVSVDSVFAKVSEFRDIVLVDQRGTGGAQRAACPDDHVRAADARAVASYLRRCFAHRAAGARRLTTAAAAADLERIRRLLGYGRIDLYGSSYGATLAQVYLQHFPASVRTATLDGGSLRSIPVYELAARNAERALRIEVARCRAQAGCMRAFPDTRAELMRVLARHPSTADALATTVAVLLRSSEDAARVPLLVHEAAIGDTAPLMREFATRVGAELDARSRLPMFWVTLCNEGWARFDVAATRSASQASWLAHAQVARARLFRRACAAVPHVTQTRDAAVPPSAVPVLMLAGQADPQDPAANLAGWRRVFPHGRLVIVRGLAHGVIGYGCLRLVVARFVARGSVRGLDTRCSRLVPVPRFELS